MKKTKLGRRLGLVAAAGLTAMAFSASTAQAQVVPLTVEYDDAALKLGTSTFDILDPPDTATMAGTIDAGNGDVNIPAAGFVFPPFTGTVPGTAVPLTVNFSAVDPITGTGSLAGDVTTAASTYRAVVALGPPFNANCQYDFELPLTTADTLAPGSAGANPRAQFFGDPFTVAVGMAGATATDGVLQGAFGAGALPPSGAAGCGLVNALTGGEGGIALSDNVPIEVQPEPPSPPIDSGPPPVNQQPKGNQGKKAKKCKKAKKKKGKKGASAAAKCKKKGKKKKKK